MFRFVRPYRWRLFFFLFTAIGYSAFNSLPILIVRELLGVIIDARQTEPLYRMVLLLSLIEIVRTYFIVRRDLAEKYLAHIAVRDATNKVMAHLMCQSLRFFERHRSGEILSRATADSQALAETVGIFTVLVSEPLTVVGAVVVLLTLNWKLALLGLVGIPVAAWPFLILSRRMRIASRQARESVADRADAMVQSLGGVRVVKGFRQEDHETARFTATNNDIFTHTIKRVRAEALSKGVVELVAGGGMVLVVLVGGLLCIRGIAGEKMGAEDLFAFVFALGVLVKPLRDIGKANGRIQDALPGAERLFELLDANEELPVDAHAANVARLREAIRLRGVGFSYGREAVLDGVSLDIEAGKVTAIVGPSGSGKSTVVNLVARFYDPDSGTVEADGLDLRNARIESWLDQIGLVTQDPVLFNTSVRQNIRYGRLDATDEEVEAAARTANIHDEVMQFTDGYETLAGERGAQMSGGQRQRICIARALVRHPAVLLLDEATSALDSASERIVQEALDRAVVGRTVLVVAHRLSTVRNADRIYVLVGGRVEASGRHEDLLDTSPTYRRLWTIQQGAPETGIWEPDTAW